MKKLLILSLFAAACGPTDDGTEQQDDPIVIVTDDNNGTSKSDGTNNANNDANNNDTTGDTNNATTAPTPEGLALLGNFQHTIDSVDYTVIATAEDRLLNPRDLAFNPAVPSELWIINVGDNSTVIVDGPGTDAQTSERLAGLGNDHFMARPSSIAFGDNGNFGTAQDTDEITQPSTPYDFMGPTLWTSDRTIYDGGHAGHLDMLHNSPNGAGIAWETENVYWVFDGFHNSITRYDFNTDHGPGGSDHRDGEVARYVEGAVSYVDGVSSHLEFHHGLHLLYVVDSGNNRVAVLDPTLGSPGQTLSPNYDGGTQYYVDGTELTTLIDGSEAGLEVPSGIAIAGETIFVSDNKLSLIAAFDFEGNLIDYLDLSSEVPSGGLMGIEVAPDGSLYAVDAVSNTVIRVAAASE